MESQTRHIFFLFYYFRRESFNISFSCQLKAVLDRAQGVEMSTRGPMIQDGINEVLRAAEADGTVIPADALQHLKKYVSVVSALSPF